MNDKLDLKLKEVVESPLDGLIQVAHAVDTDDVYELTQILNKAINRRKWELENMPKRWAHIREQKLKEMSHWVWLRDNLRDYWNTIDGIPF